MISVGPFPVLPEYRQQYLLLIWMREGNINRPALKVCSYNILKLQQLTLYNSMEKQREDNSQILLN